MTRRLESKLLEGLSSIRRSLGGDRPGSPTKVREKSSKPVADRVGLTPGKGGVTFAQIVAGGTEIPSSGGPVSRKGSSSGRLAGAAGSARAASRTGGRVRIGRGAVRRSRTAAVTLTVLPESSASYADIMWTCRREIDLKKLRIEDVKIRRAVTDGIILEIPGEDASSRADLLANECRWVLVSG